jgi:hypothetical protein
MALSKRTPTLNDVETALIPHTKAKKSLIAKASEVALGLTGAGAGILYVGPAQYCVASTRCGAWLAATATETGAIIIYTAGGLDYSLINGYFSSRSVNEFLDYINEQPTREAKIGKGAFIILFTLSQNVQTLIVSLTTSTAAWQTMLTVMGALPGAFFGAVGITRSSIPKAYSFGKNLSRSLFFPTHEFTELKRRHADFNKKLDERWRTLSGLADYIVANDRSPRDFLLNAKITPSAISNSHNVAHGVGVVTGTAIAVDIAFPFIKNTFDFLNERIQFAPASGAIAASFLITGLYGNIVVCTKAMEGLLGALVDLWQGEKVHSVAYRLRPNAVALNFFLALLPSLMSYAVVNTVYENTIPGDENDPTRETFRYAADFNICLYHVFGLMHFLNLMIEKFATNPDHQYVYEMNTEYHKLRDLTLDQFAAQRPDLKMEQEHSVIPENAQRLSGMTLVN